MLFDTHAHYDDERFDSDRQQLIETLPQKNIGLAANMGCDIKSSEMSVKLAERYSFIYAGAGIHPHSASDFNNEALQRIAELAQNPKVKAIGEIGLDYYYDFSPREKQIEAFEQQLDLAVQLGLPVVVHDRDAHEDTINILKRHKACGVVHSFSGSMEMAKILLDMGWYLSFNGVITFKNAKKPVEVVRMMPTDRILAETDCPYLTPEPFRGQRNDSSYIKFVVQRIAEIKQIEYNEAEGITFNNGKRFFRI